MRLSRADVLAFAAGLTSMLQVRVIGYLGIVEIAFLALAPFYLLGRRRLLFSGRLRPFLVLSAAWLGSALLTDLVRGSELHNTLRGAFTVVLWLACLICMYVLLAGRLALIKPYALGLACSTFLCLHIFQPGTMVGLAAYQGTSIQSIVTFRSAYAGVLAQFVAALAVLGFRRYPRLVLAGMACFALLSFVYGSRAIAATYLVAALMSYYLYRQALGRRRTGQPFALSRRQRLQLVLGFAVACVVTVAGYSIGASRGWLGQVAAAREGEMAESRLGMMVGRAQLLFGLLAVKDSPIIGYGSWARDTKGYYARGLEMIGLGELAAKLASREELTVMPGHSHIVGAWVSHGLLGGVFWLFVYGFLLRFVVRYLPGEVEYLPYTLLTLLTMLWSVLASPFGARPATAAMLVFLIVSSERVDARRAQAGAAAPEPGSSPAGSPQQGRTAAPATAEPLPG